MPSKEHILAFALAAVALFSGAGCGPPGSLLSHSAGSNILTDFEYGYIVRCVPDEVKGGVLQAYAVGADGSLSPVTNNVNGEECSPSSGDDARPNTISAPQTSTNAPAAASSPIHSAASTPAGTPQFQDQYPLLGPLPFLPGFSSMLLASYPPAQCTPNTGVYMTNHLSSTVTHYSTCPLSVRNTIQVPANPEQLAITPDGSTLIVTCYGNAIVFINTATDAILTTLNVSGYPNGLAISPDGTTAYVTSYFNINPLIYTINIASRTITAMTQVSSYPKSIFLTPDGLQAWVLFYQSSTIYVFDTLSMTVVSTLNAGGLADTTMAFNPTGTRAYVAVASNQMVVFDTSTLAQIASVTVGQLPSDVYVTPDGTRAYVQSQQDSFISYINLTTNTLIANYPVTGPGMGFQIFH
jgi:YVTN family beta-propeller protein